MFINIRLSKIFRIFFVCVSILMIILFGISIFKIYSKSTLYSQVNSNNSETIEITSKNYTNVLKAVHDNPDSYVGLKIHFVGFVYRVFDLTDNQFVLARNMIINAENHTVVVGFLCESQDAKSYDNNTWVEITGTITSGNYHGKMPIIKIESINKTNSPNDEFVYPPNDSFVPTNSII